MFVAVICVLIFGGIICSDGGGGGGSSSRGTSANRNRYKGGTLHGAGVLAWQEADYQDKLATCADFIATQWQSGNFKSLIQNTIETVDDMRPYAIELIICLETATKKYPDPETNDKMYANQTVAEMAVMCMVMMDWMR